VYTVQLSLASTKLLLKSTVNRTGNVRQRNCCRAVRCEADDKSDEVGEDEGEDEEEVDPPPPPSLRDA